MSCENLTETTPPLRRRKKAFLHKKGLGTVQGGSCKIPLLLSGPAPLPGGKVHLGGRQDPIIVVLLPTYGTKVLTTSQRVITIFITVVYVQLRTRP